MERTAWKHMPTCILTMDTPWVELVDGFNWIRHEELRGIFEQKHQRKLTWES